MAPSELHLEKVAWQVPHHYGHPKASPGVRARLCLRRVVLSCAWLHDRARRVPVPDGQRSDDDGARARVDRRRGVLAILILYRALAWSLYSPHGPRSQVHQYVSWLLAPNPGDMTPDMTPET